MQRSFPAPAGSPMKDDFSTSHFQKTVRLYDWWLVRPEGSSHKKALAVAGFTSPKQPSVQQAVRVFKSAPITRMYDFSTLETEDGICVVVIGLINKSLTTENGFSSEVFNHFVFGFPPNWEECALGCLDEEVERVTKSGSYFSALTSSTDAKISELDEVSPCKSKRDRGDNKQNAHFCDGSPFKSSNLCSSYVDPHLPFVNVGGLGDGESSAAIEISQVDPPHKSGVKGKGNINGERSYWETSEMNAQRESREKCASKLLDKTAQGVLMSGSKSRSTSSGDMTFSNLDKGSLCKNKRDLSEDKHDAQLQNGSSAKSARNCSTNTDAAIPNADMGCMQGVKEGGNVKGSSSRNKTAMKSHYNLRGTLLTSPDSFKRSRSGRLLLPRLEFWRNQVAVYDTERGVAGIKDGRSVNTESAGPASASWGKRRQNC